MENELTAGLIKKTAKEILCERIKEKRAAIKNAEKIKKEEKRFEAMKEYKKSFKESFICAAEKHFNFE